MIDGEERLSPLLDKLAKKLAEVQRAAKTSEGVDKMAASLANVSKQMQAIDRFAAANKGFATARQNFRQAEEAVDRAARAMKSAEAPTRQLEAAYQRAQSAVKSASRAFEMQSAAVLGAKRALEGFGIPIGNAVAHQQRLAAAVDKANAAMQRQERHGGGGIGMLGMMAGPAILHGTKIAVTEGAHIQSEIVKMRTAGIPEPDIQREVSQSAELAAKYPNVKRSTILERYKELRSVVLHPEEAHELLDTTVSANSAMNAIDRTGHMAQGLQFAVKGAEVLGLAQDPKRFKDYLNAFVKAQQVMGKTITPEQMFEFAKYSKASGASLSDRFKFTTGVSLSQEMGGSTAGVSVDQFVKQITGGFQGSQHSAAKEFVAMGLADKNDFTTTKTGSIKGMKPGRRLKGSDLDPDEYVYKHLLPALIAHGYKDQKSQIAQVRRMFPSGRAADLVTKIITQRASFENHAKLYGEAQGLDAGKNNKSDPFVGLNSLTTSLENFAATLTSPMMEAAGKALSNMADWVGKWGKMLAEWQEKNKQLAEIAGTGAVVAGAAGGTALTYSLLKGLFTGFGLTGSATALDGSAALLSAAAKELMLAARVPGTPATPPGSPLTPPGFTGMLPGVSTALLAWDVYQKGQKNLEGVPHIGFAEWWHHVTGGKDDRDFLRPDNARPFTMKDIEGLSGNAEISTSVTVAPSPDFLTKIETKIKNAIKGVTVSGGGSTGTVDANGPGSLGTSSPDAAAYPRNAP